MSVSNTKCKAYAEIDGIVAGNLHIGCEVIHFFGKKVLTSLETVRMRIMATITQRRTTITIELTILNQCILGSKMCR